MNYGALNSACLIRWTCKQ